MFQSHCIRENDSVVLEDLPGTARTAEILHDIFKAFVHSEEDKPLFSLTQELTLGTSA